MAQYASVFPGVVMETLFQGRILLHGVVALQDVWSCPEHPQRHLVHADPPTFPQVP